MEKPLPPVVLLPEEEVQRLWERRNYLREKLRIETKTIKDEIDEIEKKLGLDEMEWVDHYSGTNCEEWKCVRCGKTYVSPRKALCPVCRPFKDETKEEP